MSLTSNFLDHLDGRLEKQGGRGSVARLLLVATKGKAADDPDAVVRYHEQVRVFDDRLKERTIVVLPTWCMQRLLRAGVGYILNEWHAQ